MEGQVARSIRNRKRNELQTFGTINEDDGDDDFHQNPMKNIKMSEEEMEVQKIKRQLEYYGNKLEPLNMKNERDSGQIDRDGLFNFDRMKEKQQDDAWLQALDENDNLDEVKLKRKVRGVFDDNEGSEEENDNDLGKKKVKLIQDVPEQNPAQMTRKERLAKLPFIALKKRILGFLIDENESVNKAFIRLKKEFPAHKIQKQVFKKNIRKKDLEKQKMEEEKQDLTDEQLGKSNSSEDQFEQLVELSDLVVIQTGSADIYTMSKKEMEKSIEEDIEKQKRDIEIQRIEQQKRQQQQQQDQSLRQKQFQRIQKEKIIEEEDEDSHYSSEDSQQKAHDSDSVNLTSDDEGKDNKSNASKEEKPQKQEQIPKKSILKQQNLQSEEINQGQLINKILKKEKKVPKFEEDDLPQKPKIPVEQQPDEDDIF